MKKNIWGKRGEFLGGIYEEYIIVIDTFADLTSSIFYLVYLGGCYVRIFSEIIYLGKIQPEN